MRPINQLPDPHWRQDPTPDFEGEGRRAFVSLEEEILSRRLGGPGSWVREHVRSEEHLESLGAADLLAVLRGFMAAAREDLERRVGT
jgi:hypothetical protein